jgi:hypothetical protein
MNKNVSDQEQPIPNDSKAIWDLVKKDIEDRNEAGIKKYGTPLQAFNGRDSLIDAYQEALDLVVYLRQAIEEKKAMVAAIKSMAVVTPTNEDKVSELSYQSYELLKSLGEY